MIYKHDLPYVYSKPGKYKTLFIRVFFTVFVFTVFSLLANTVYANNMHADNKPDLSGATRGSVWLLPSDGVYIEALQLESNVDINVSGMIARANVRQQFRNTSSLWAEGLYVFPLPDNAAVDHFRILIDGRVIHGEIQEKQQARKTYETARRNGRRTGLVEQQRANIFTTSLANIAPGSEMTVEIEYQQTLEYRDGVYKLRYPLVVGERYITPSKEGAFDPSYDMGVYTETSTTSNTLNPTAITINMDTGIPIANIVSTSHPVIIYSQDENRYQVTLRDKMVPADRDFLLKWEPELGKLPKSAVFNQQHADDEYSLITIYPPINDLYNPLDIPREIVFILDVSGSMSGTSIEQAKLALTMALDRLKSSDKFNIIWFNNEAKKLYYDSEYASIDNIHFARRVIHSLDANGGTEMLPALELALNMRAEPEFLRQLVFLTDGNVSNERDLFSYIQSHLNDSRLFTVGIGSAPNGFFMKRAAHAGRGTYTFISNTQEVAEKTDKLFRKLETPALTDIRLTMSGEEIEYYPNPIPDMYIDEPVTVLVRGKKLDKSVHINGKIGSSKWQQTLSIDQGYENQGVRTAWARNKIGALSQSYHEAQTEYQKAHYKKEIIDVSLTHHLVSRYTSLVAVDKTPANQGGSLYKEQLKNNLPHGWSNQKNNDKKSLAQINLPQTATPYSWHLRLAFIFLAFSMLLSFVRVKQ